MTNNLRSYGAALILKARDDIAAAAAEPRVRASLSVGLDRKARMVNARAAIGMIRDEREMEWTSIYPLADPAAF